MSEIILFCLGTVGLDIISFCLGAILVLIAVVGGGLKIKELSIPKVNRFARIISGIMGFVFVIVGLWVGGMFQLAGDTGGTGSQTDSNNVIDKSGGQGGTGTKTEPINLTDTSDYLGKTEPNTATEKENPKDPIPQKLPAPKQISPDEGAIHQSRLSPVLKWTEVTGAASYTIEIEVKSSGDEWKPFRTVPDHKPASYTLSYLFSSTNVRWRVWAVDSDRNEGNKTNWRRFTRIRKSSEPQTTLKLSKPTQLFNSKQVIRDSRTNRTITLCVLSWKAVPGAKSYTVNIFEFKSGKWVGRKPITNITTTKYTLKDVRELTRVRWSVCAVDSTRKEGPKAEHEFRYR